MNKLKTCRFYWTDIMLVPQSVFCFLGEVQLKRPWSWQFCSRQSSDHQNPFINGGWILLLCFFSVVEIYLLLSYLDLCRDLSLSSSIGPCVSLGILWFFFCHTNKACRFFCYYFFCHNHANLKLAEEQKKKIIIIRIIMIIKGKNPS